ncbi:MAG: hypothetical protein A3H57_01670 [Candidatus Taylorbacteria bacterium RIFCSPLOWO2_02_FULL_43_11]|uniref:Uncharacterized protein n=1 Tax=Candidatus Taylorbacteria bacterium RIFCSPHIGHO2_02_FULL_43_32b TaxID=1802306 RepID=A0A1G2MI09_9BACT|nr:MAG: hypothetical protein A2743_01645 [Candidatus Taylorbacteria bacterium RIFCSPHIGHO2_01_FULL_43_47]OHA23560.1 MAG: hypothetical protein A3C72_04200 [Candidatus Taylorbacteria bacterium RIFCSPHIGHO2_02_FULL_43_32b]OHA30585.1 MAG: hypothetical protein A3B08_02775 [Candidatus Taylorbacteria bacterium RIFCSPLOWO2_01_FULL_43_44]OHA36831.1 MAG: hypothetical protein A3H57_01670 [Candidatus Taylorbacteria bacterium RIFCSPLOWO2_02_FULL_43_11]
MSKKHKKGTTLRLTADFVNGQNKVVRKGTLVEVVSYPPHTAVCEVKVQGLGHNILPLRERLELVH